MKHQALLTIQAKLKLTKLAIILFYFSVAIDCPISWGQPQYQKWRALTVSIPDYGSW